MIVVPSADVKDKVMDGTSIQRGCHNLQRERRTGFHGKESAFIEELDKKEPGDPGEHEVIIFLLTAGVGFEQVDGMALGVEHESVRRGAVGPSRVGGWMEREGAAGFNRRRHGLNRASNAESLATLFVDPLSLPCPLEDRPPRSHTTQCKYPFVRPCTLDAPR